MIPSVKDAMIDKKSSFTARNYHQLGGAGPGFLCPAGYDYIAGDKAGWGDQVSGGSTPNVLSIAACANLCGENLNCLSFEYYPTRKVCNRNSVRLPDAGSSPHEDSAFCSKTGTSPTVQAYVPPASPAHVPPRYVQAPAKAPYVQPVPQYQTIGNNPINGSCTSTSQLTQAWSGFGVGTELTMDVCLGKCISQQGITANNPGGLGCSAVSFVPKIGNRGSCTMHFGLQGSNYSCTNN